MQSCNHQGKSRSAACILSLSMLVLWLIAAVPVVAEINGAAIYENYGKEQYLAVLQLAETTASAELAIQQSNQVGAVMEFVVLAESISSRRMSRHWRESVLVNVDRPAIEANSQALASLSSMLKGPLKRGDKLSIARRSGGVDIALNQTIIGTLDAPDLLNAMIHIWVGPVPPSSAFRNAILGDGQLDSGLLRRYENISVVGNRQNEIEQLWLAPAEELIPIAAEAVAEVQAQPEPVLLASVSGAALAGVDQGLATVIDAAPAQVTLVQTDTEPLPENVQVSGLAPAGVSNVAGADTNIANEQLLEQTLDAPQAQQEPIALVSADNNADTELAVLDTQLATLSPEHSQQEDAILSSKIYYDEIKSKIYRRVNYPAIALRRGSESEVTLSVQIDPAGELLAVEVSEGSQFNYFNKAATKAVKSASPFGPPPQTLVDNGVYELKMQVNFRIDS